MLLKRTKTHPVSNIAFRARISLGALYFLLFLVTIRLFYWQVIQNNQLSTQAENQYTRSIETTGKRGSLYTSEGFLLVGNQQVYTLFAQPHVLTQTPEKIATTIAPLLLLELKEYTQATQSSTQKEVETQFVQQLSEKLSKDTKWISLKTKVSQQTKDEIEKLELYGLGFDPHLERFYPEASMAAHLTGFVGKDAQGQDLGYFGIEGAMEQELKARFARNTILTDALGLQLSGKNSPGQELIDGKNVTLTIQRDVQHLIETELKKAVERYGAKSGEVIVMQPQTGKILGLAAYPNYSPAEFYETDPLWHKNPTLSDTYEPGSTLKALTVAAGIEAGVITPETECDSCAGPKKFQNYTIRTWNDQYTPNITMKEGLAKSDNTAMIFIAQKLGIETFKTFLQKFKIGDPIGIELQEDKKTPFPNDWGEIKLATVSFGQGIVANSMQVLRAINTIANNGVMVRPMIVESVSNPINQSVIVHEPTTEGQVISLQTAQTVTDMLVYSAQGGEAQWTASAAYPVAGKTGTSQVVTEKGYDAEKTIASFVGFAPPEDPEFTMIVKLVEPTSSPWAAETAAPLWHTIARKLSLLLQK